MSDGVLFVKLKRCLGCWFVQGFENKVCSQCGKLFVREATSEEKQVEEDALIKRREKAGL